jgi:hypothetical protein
MYITGGLGNQDGNGHVMLCRRATALVCPRRRLASKSFVSADADDLPLTLPPLRWRRGREAAEMAVTDYFVYWTISREVQRFESSWN